MNQASEACSTATTTRDESCERAESECAWTRNMICEDAQLTHAIWIRRAAVDAWCGNVHRHTAGRDSRLFVPAECRWPRKRGVERRWWRRDLHRHASRCDDGTECDRACASDRDGEKHECASVFHFACPSSKATESGGNCASCGARCASPTTFRTVCMNLFSMHRDQECTPLTLPNSRCITALASAPSQSARSGIRDVAILYPARTPCAHLVGSSNSNSHDTDKSHHDARDSPAHQDSVDPHS